ncbi:Negative regulator of mitotic exit [Modicella reniformis]|uniref:Negative regulator of mitotic exit n=1 Tax=Modicella reniformis TaxID=1440133 RepID=A0A9P6MLG7_9FUNG|nr:Negative regulator of mitotic exit [Modicella reniformis]
MRLFSTKKKEDPSHSQQGSNGGAKQQQLPPAPSSVQGSNNNSSNIQGGVPMHGNSNHIGHHSTSPSFGLGGMGNGVMTPMSPVGQQAPFTPIYSPPSPTQLQNPNFAPNGPPPSVVQLTTPQLFWTQRRILGTNPFPRFQHTTSATVNGTDIYLYGGYQRGTTKGDLFIIDSGKETGIFSETDDNLMRFSLECHAVAAAGADPPMPKSGHSAVNIGQYIIYFGGWDSMTRQCDDNLHVLHTARKEWNKPPINGPLPTPRHSHTGCSIGTTMFIFGGQVDNYYLDDVLSFDMKTITHNPRWEKLAPQTESPPARAGHCAAVHEGKIYVFGGADSDYFYNDIWCFDPRALTWTPIPASGYLPSGRHGHSCTVADGIMYVFGGNSPDGSELNDSYAFKIHERRWYLFQNVGPVASARSGHSMCTIKDRIFVLGGESEQTKLEDSALIYYLEIPKIRYPDSAASMLTSRHASQKFNPNKPGDGQVSDQSASGGYESDRSSGQSRPPERPERPERRNTQRPTSPTTLGSIERHGSSSSSTSQPTNQLMSLQHGQRSMTSFGAPPPRGASAGFQSTDYQADGLSIATRRQMLRDDYQGGYGGAVVGTVNPVNTNRNGLHQLSTSPSFGGPSHLPLRVINVSPSGSPTSSRPLPGGGTSPTTSRPPDHRAMNFVPPPPGAGINVMEDINPYAMEAISIPPPPTSQNPISPASQGTYIPPPPSKCPPGEATPLSSPIAMSPTSPTNLQPLPPGMVRTNLPPPLSTPSSAAPASIPHPHPHPPGSEKKVDQVQPPNTPHSVGSSTPIPGPLDRSASRSSGRYAAHGLGGSAPSIEQTLNQPSILGTDAATVARSADDMPKALESRADAVQDENEHLKRQLTEKQEELEKMKKRENWLMTEVILARDSLGSGKKDDSKDHPSKSFQNKRLSIMDLEKELEGGELEGQQLKITKALIKVKEELKAAKMSIATQAQTASSKIREAERVRTGALQEAAYLKAKLSSMSNAHQDPGALGRVEMERAADLEKRLTTALNELETLEAQYAKAQEKLEQEKLSRISAEERSHGSTLLAEQAQSAHTRALSEIASLHSRATKAETESREYATQLAETQAGFSGHQSQSTGLLQKIKSLKQQVEEHEKALERTQMAFSAANERAMRAEARSDEDSAKIEKLESMRFELSSEATRYKGEAEMLQSRVEDLENRWQVSKDEVMTLRKLVEDGLGAFNPRGRIEKTAERKHDSIAILSTVSRVSELEHELGSLKKLHAHSQLSASKSAAELAEAMIEISRLEQVSMQARAETISLQKTLSQGREGAAQLKNELSRTEQELEAKIKEIEDHEVQLGLLKDVMREKGIIAEDVIMQARVRGTPEYATTLEEKVKEAEERVKTLQQELTDSQNQYKQRLDTLEAQHQSTIQYSEKKTLLLRKIKNDLEETMKEKDEAEAELRQLQEEHARCDEIVASCKSQKEQEEEERRGLTSQANDLQNRLMESEMHSAELSQKVISITERLQELEGLNEAMADDLEGLQLQSEELKINATKQEKQLKADVERLVNEIHQVQEKLHSKQAKLDDALDLNEQLERQLERALETQAAAIASSSGQSSHDSEALQKLERQRQDLEQRLKKTQETIQILEGDNSVLEARLSDSEKKVTLLLENIQNNMSDVSNPTSPLNSANLAGVHQQLNNHLHGKGSALSYQRSPVMNAHRLINNTRGTSNGGKSISPAGGLTASPLSNKIANSSSSNGYMQAQQLNEFSEDEYQYGHATTLRYQQQQQQQQQHSSNRDSVDSITRELEMLKVPWNKGPIVYTNPSIVSKSNDIKSPSPKNSPTVAFVPQQQPTQRRMSSPAQNQHTYQYSSKLNNHQAQFYDYSDSSDGDNEEEYLTHLRQQQQHTMDTHTFNDRSPSRLKEYEQMIDEIENSRLH